MQNKWVIAVFVVIALLVLTLVVLNLRNAYNQSQQRKAIVNVSDCIQYCLQRKLDFLNCTIRENEVDIVCDETFTLKQVQVLQ